MLLLAVQCPPEAKFVPLNGNTISPVHHENLKIMTRSEINSIPSWDKVCVHACVCAVGMYTHAVTIHAMPYAARTPPVYIARANALSVLMLDSE